MKAVFLGTASMVPTKHRNVSSVFVEHLGDCYLCDCGEGTQRQMNIAGLNRHRVNTVLISHWHGDHMSGLIGLLQTKDKVPEPEPVTIIGPNGSKDHMDHLLQSCHFNLSYDVEVVEVPRSEDFDWSNDETRVEACYLDHGVPCVGFRIAERAKRRVKMDALREKGVPEGPHIGELQGGQVVTYDGKQLDPDTYTYIPEEDVVAYVVDTRPCEGARRLADQANVLIAEATFDNDTQKRAREYGHMTAEEAAEIAVDATVDRLFLTHFSQRFRDVKPLAEEARSVFDDTVPAKDFLEVNVPAAESERSD